MSLRERVEAVSVRVETVAERIDGWTRAVNATGCYDGNVPLNAAEIDRLEAAGKELANACRQYREADWRRQWLES